MPMTWAQSPSSTTKSAIPNSPAEGTIRVATYNVSLHRKKLGELAENLQQDDAQAVQLARVIQTVRPDIFLVNEIDYVPEAKTAILFRDKFLHQYSSFGDSKKPTLEWPFFFAGPVNTGVDSGLDLNQNGKVHDPDDSWGFGYYDGQYGMAVYSRFPIDKDRVRTFQNFRWASMPDAKKPIRKDGKPFWDDEIWEKLRLSSKSHWDIPIEVDGKKLHLLASHPTPPVFDGRKTGTDVEITTRFDSGPTTFLRSPNRLISKTTLANRADSSPENRSSSLEISIPIRMMVMGNVRASKNCWRTHVSASLGLRLVGVENWQPWSKPRPTRNIKVTPNKTRLTSATIDRATFDATSSYHRATLLSWIVVCSGPLPMSASLSESIRSTSAIIAWFGSTSSSSLPNRNFATVVIVAIIP